MISAKKIVFLYAAIILGGCTSPLKSDDPATRVKAVAELSDDKELFFVAMNVGVHIGMREGSYYNAFLTEENYADDVRVAAVKRLKNIDYLLCCAAWQDGDLYADSGLELGRLELRGKNYYVYDSDSRLLVKVKPGDAVRSAAVEQLKDPGVFRQIAKSFVEADGQGPIRKRLFPSGRRWTGSGWSDGKETSFVDYYGQAKKDNPLNSVLSRIIRAQKDQFALCAFVVAARENGAEVYPDAVVAAIETLDGSNQSEIVRAFNKLYLAKEKYKRTVPVLWGWKLLNAINDPSDDCMVAMASLGYGSAKKDNEAARIEIDRIAEAKFSDAVWSKCYQQGLFAGYSGTKMVKNIRTSDGMERFLIESRRINVDDVDVAFERIKDAETLAKIKRDCYLKVVAEKAEVLHFAMTYQRRLEEISKMSAKIERALASHEFRKVMQKIKIEEGKKRKLTILLQKWIDVGADQIVAEADVMADTSFSVAGFRPGMKCDEAKLLFECRYPEEEIAWSVDEKGLVDRINLGSTFLAKVYKFNVQTWAEWVAAFSRQTGVRFSCDVLRDEKKPIGGRGTIVKVSQKIWRCQDGHKDQTITYFGDKNVQEIEPEASGFVENVFKIARGVTGGDIVKEVVLEGTRHWANKGWEAEIGGHPGMLRIERGTVGPGGTRKIVQPTSRSGLDRTADSVKDTWDAMKDAAPAVENFMNNLLK